MFCLLAVKRFIMDGNMQMSMAGYDVLSSAKHARSVERCLERSLCTRHREMRRRYYPYKAFWRYCIAYSLARHRVKGRICI